MNIHIDDFHATYNSYCNNSQRFTLFKTLTFYYVYWVLILQNHFHSSFRALIIKKLVVVIYCLQKNPNAIRHPEEDKGRDYVETHLVIDLSQSAVISPFIAQQCGDASEFIYVKDDDLRAIAQSMYCVMELLVCIKQLVVFKLK